MCAAHAQVAPVLADKMGMRLPGPDPETSWLACVCLSLDTVVLHAPPLLVGPRLVAAYTQGLRHNWEVSSKACGMRSTAQHPCYSKLLRASAQNSLEMAGN